MEWNQVQLAIAKGLLEGKTAAYLEKAGFAHKTIYKVKHVLKIGNGPASVTDEDIAKAPPPSSFEEKKFTSQQSQQAPTTVKPGSGDGAKAFPPAALLRLTGTRIDAEYTPIMAMARMAAIDEWKWPPDIKIEDFLDTVLYHFFKDRGITLQGYIVDESLLKEAESGVTGG